MSLRKSIHKRKARRLYGYLFLGVGIFSLVLALCMGIFYLKRLHQQVLSPLAAVSKIVFASDTDVLGTQVQDMCQTYSLSCKNVVVAKDIITFTIDNHTITISRSKNIGQEMASLQLTIRALTMEGKGYHGLDFRYDRPVITY